MMNDEYLPFVITHRLRQTDLELHSTDYSSGCELPAHYHQEPRFVVTVQGSFSETSGKQAYLCTSSTLVYRPAGEEHSNSFQQGPARCISIRLGAKWFARFRQPSDSWQASLYRNDSQFTDLALRLHREMQEKDPVSSLAIDAIVLELSVQTQRSRELRFDAIHEPWIKRIVDLIHGQFCEPLTLKELAASVDVHPVYMIRAFRNRYGCTPADYIRTLRIQHAKEMLRKSNLSLAEIAQASGFCDQSHFSRIFKRFIGVTPARYRRNNRP